MIPELVVADTVPLLMPDRFRPIEMPWGGLLNPGGHPVPVTMCWSAANPYAVVFEFWNGREWVDWELDRWLLTATLVGPVAHRELLGPAGEGDVVMDHYEGGLILELNSPTGHALFWFNPDPVAEFLHTTYRAVLPGDEQLGDWDAALAELCAPDGGGRR